MRARASISAALVSMAATLALMLVITPVSLATDDFTWSGANTATSSLGSLAWSQVLNWSGGSTPTSSVSQLSFPDLGGACDTGTPVDACYDSLDDAGPVTADDVRIDDDWPYTIVPTNGSTIAIDTTGGIFAYSSGTVSPYYAPDIAVPVILDGFQYWDLEGSNLSDDPGDGSRSRLDKRKLRAGRGPSGGSGVLHNDRRDRDPRGSGRRDGCRRTTRGWHRRRASRGWHHARGPGGSVHRVTRRHVGIDHLQLRGASRPGGRRREGPRTPL